ncbi:MAG: putative sulfate exporter family transporter [Woeseiaceae bacterium]|nr:putative sulfate exporter family transporter [Woeseiaceae bacterium]
MQLSSKSPLWWAGIGLAIVTAVAATYTADWVGEAILGFERSPVSAIMMAIIIGMLLANVTRLPAGMLPGLRLCTTTILRIGIMLLGIRLSLTGAGRFTLVALPFVIFAIAVGLTIVGLMGRSLGLSRRLSGLIAVGTSICGATAIVATAPLIEADESEVSYSIACITVFGLAAMFLYPLLAYALFSGQAELAGLFLGTSIHETAQVAGAGLMYEAQYNAPVALDIATVTKLTRNLCMIAVIPLVGILYTAEHRAVAAGEINWLKMIPWFIVGFALMSAFRTVGDLGDRAFGILDAGQWNGLVRFLRAAAENFLLVAMAAVGLTSTFAGIRKIGMRPFALGLFAALVVGGASLVAISLFAESLIKVLGM